MEIWAVSVAGAMQKDGNTVSVESGCCLVRAANQNEALGKAYQIAQKLMPSNKGWRGVHVKASNVVLEPDDAKWCCEKCMTPKPDASAPCPRCNPPK